MTTNRFRQTRSAHQDIGFRYDDKWEFYVGGEPHDLTQYTSLTAIVFNAANSKVDDFTMTVLTDAADLTTNSAGVAVANKATFTFAPTGSAGSFFIHVVGVKSGSPYQIGKPAELTYHAGPPAS